MWAVLNCSWRYFLKQNIQLFVWCIFILYMFSVSMYKLYRLFITSLQLSVPNGGRIISPCVLLQCSFVLIFLGIVVHSGILKNGACPILTSPLWFARRWFGLQPKCQLPAQSVSGGWRRLNLNICGRGLSWSCLWLLSVLASDSHWAIALCHHSVYNYACFNVRFH